MASMLLPVVVLFSGSLAVGADRPGDALAVMKTVAANTSAAAEGRRQYVYTQKVRASLLRSNGQVVCKESREYTVIPQERTTDKTLVSFAGECREGKRMVPYTAPEVKKPGLKDTGLKEKGSPEDGDRESIAGVINGLANARNSRDGIPRELFPLLAEDLPYYNFTLKAETLVQGRRAYDILFEPVDRKDVCIHVGEDNTNFSLHVDLHTDNAAPEGTLCRPWKGEAWIDAEDYQPIRIDTQLAKGVPWGVRVFLGIDIRQLGFSIAYKRVAESVWFPATYGTEFRVVVFWGYRRTITMSMENTDFRKTDAKSTIQFGQPDK
jgi:hypothetical protein